MSRPNLDPVMAAALANGTIVPAMMAELTFKSGVQRVWSGVGPLSWNAKTWTGLGELASVGAITEASAVQAEGTTVTLAGIGLSQIDIMPPSVTPPDPPFTPAAGESVAWSIATVPPVPGIITPEPAYFNSGTASGTVISGSIGLVGGAPIPNLNTLGLDWSGYQRPLEIPPGAIITRVHPVIVISEIKPGGNMGIKTSFPETLTPDLGTVVGSDIKTWAGARISAFIESSVDGGTDVLDMDIEFIGLAVYYIGSPLSQTSILYEAMSDIRLGGPAKIWFGLMAEGVFLGAPYLVFSGSVDKPSVKMSPEAGGTITLALENRMVNLQRPSNRKYTAADQHLNFPDDTFFNFVELLQDIALREGS